MTVFSVILGSIWVIVALFSLYAYIAAIRAKEQQAATRALVTVFGALIMATLMVDRLP